MSENMTKIDELLAEYTIQRDALKEMINDLERLKDKIDTLFPKKLDARYTNFFEEKIKATTEFFRTILDMRKEIIRTVKDEVELRRKLTINEDDPNSIGELIDISGLAKKVEKFQKEKLEQEEKMEEV